MENVIQWLGTVGIAAFYPIQNWRLVLARNPVGLSFLAFSFLAVGIAGYIALGLHLGLVVLAGGNMSNLVFASVILLLIWFRSSALTQKERVAGLSVLIIGIGFLALLHMIASRETAASLRSIPCRTTASSRKEILRDFHFSPLLALQLDLLFMSGWGLS